MVGVRQARLAEEELKKRRKKKEKEEKKEEPPEPKPSPPKPTVGAPTVIRDQDTGRISGVKIGDRTLLDLSEEDVAAILGQQAPQPTPAGALEATDVLQQQQAQQLAGQVAPLLPGAVAPTSPIDIQQALTAGAATAVPGAVGGAAVGAIAGGVGAVPLAGVGAIGGFITGVVSNLRSQRAGQITAEKFNLQKSEQNMRTLITSVNQGGDPVEATDFFNAQLVRIDQAHSKLKQETQSDLNKFLGKDGTPELEKFENFYSFGGSKDVLVGQFTQAIISPDPTKLLIFPSDLE